MATVRDLYTKVSEETALDFEECRHLCRTMQQAGLLAKGRRGGWKDAPEITHADCARFMVALAATRTSGSRTVEGVRESVEKFSALIWRDPPGYRETLLERLVMILQYEMDFSSVSPGRIAFWDDDVWPTVELDYGPWKVGDRWWAIPDQVFERPGRRWTKKDETALDTGQFAAGFKFGPRMLLILRFLLTPTERWPARRRFLKRLYRPFKDVFAERQRAGLDRHDPLFPPAEPADDA